ncbi:MAG: hypothetical protein V3V81_07365 [Candidatus Bathyarchaeia archaeon]
MKTVQDKDGNIIEVADDTPCHAGKNRALPIMYDTVKDANIFTEMAERDAKYSADAPKRATQNIKNKINDLEAQITPRRLREAVLGNVEWLANQEALILTERAKL